MTIDYDDYHPDFKEVSKKIRLERAHNRCECDGRCGYDHQEENGKMDLEADEAIFWKWTFEEYIEAYGADTERRCRAFNYIEHPITRSLVVLTVAHLDHDKQSIDPDKLMAMCQRCHLGYDSEENRRKRAETRRRVQVDGGQQELFPDDQR